MLKYMPTEKIPFFFIGYLVMYFKCWLTAAMLTTFPA